jgi:hypothetical protein
MSMMWSHPALVVVVLIVLVALLPKSVKSDDRKYNNEYITPQLQKLSIRTYILQFFIAIFVFYLLYIVLYRIGAVWFYALQ